MTRSFSNQFQFFPSYTKVVPIGSFGFCSQRGYLFFYFCNEEQILPCSLFLRAVCDRIFSVFCYWSENDLRFCYGLGFGTVSNLFFFILFSNIQNIYKN